MKIKNYKFNLLVWERINGRSVFTPHLKADNFKISEDSRSLSAGFTLIEMLVTVLVFSMLAVIITAIFTQAVRVERRAVLAQRVQENAMFVLESIAKEIRVSNIVDQNSNCTATTLTMDHPVYGAVTYSLTSEGNIQRQGSSTAIVNSSETQFTRFNFCISGSGINDNRPVRVTMLISLKNRSGPQAVSADLQTTIVSRDTITEFQNP